MPSAREVRRPRSRDGQRSSAREAVGDDAVDLLGHAHVERAQPGLDVRERARCSLAAASAAGERRVGVAVDEHRVGPPIEDGALDADQHRAPSARRASPSRRSSRTSGSAEAELLVEDARELVVVVLARVGDDELDVLGELGVQRRGLDELGPVAGDGEQAHRQEGTGRAAASRLPHLQYCQRASNRCSLAPWGSWTELRAAASACAQRHACWRGTRAIRSRVRACAGAVDAQLRRAGRRGAGRRRRAHRGRAGAALRARRPSSRCRSSWSARAPPRSPATRPSTTAAAARGRRSRSATRCRSRRSRARAPGSLADGLDEVAAAAHLRRVRADLVRRARPPRRTAARGHRGARRGRRGTRRRAAALDLLPRRSPTPRRGCAATCAAASPASERSAAIVQRAREIFAARRGRARAPPRPPPRPSRSPPPSSLSVHDEARPSRRPAGRRRRGRRSRGRGAPGRAQRAVPPLARAARPRATAPAPAPAPRRDARRRGRRAASAELVHLRPVLLRLLRDLRPHMRTIAALALFLLALCAPAPALAGTFVVPFGDGTPMLAAGWTAKPDAGAVCGYEGTGTVFLNAGTLPAHSGCFYLFNAPGAGPDHGRQRDRSATPRRAPRRRSAPTPSRRSRATRCAAAPAGRTRTRSRRAARTGSSSASTTRARTPIALATPRANNVVFSSGWVTLADPTAPGLAANGPTRRADRPLARMLQWAASDPESGAPAVAYADRRRRARRRCAGRRARGCAARAPAAAPAIDLGGARRRAAFRHRLRAVVRRRRGAASARSRSPSTAPRRRSREIQVEPDAAAPATGWWGHAPVALTVSSPTAADVVRLDGCASTGRRGRSCSTRRLRARSRSAPCRPAPSAATAPTRSTSCECDAGGHCTASPRAGFHWDGAAPPAGRRRLRPAARHARGARRRAPDVARAAGAARARAASPARSSASGRRPRRPARGRARLDRAGRPGRPASSEAAIAAAARARRRRRSAWPSACSRARASPRASAGVRCAAVDEQPPERRRCAAACAWSGGAQTVALAAERRERRGVLAGAARRRARRRRRAARSRSRGEGAHVLRAVARDGAGNETVVERALGVDASRAGRSARVTRRLPGARGPGRRRRCALGRRARRGAPRRHARSRRGSRRTAARAVARVPAGFALDGAAVAVRVLRRLDARQRERARASLPVRPLPALRGLSVAGGRVTRARRRGSRPPACRSGPIRRAARRASSARTRRGRTARSRCACTPRAHDALRRRGAREPGPARPRRERVAGTPARDGAHHAAAACASAATASSCARASAAAARPRACTCSCTTCAAGRWVEGCLEHGRPGVHLERTGGSGARAASRRAPAAAPGPTASSWRRPRAPGRGARRRAPRAASSCRSERRMWDPRATSCDSQVKAAIGAARTWEDAVSIGLFALWVGWPGGLALYACGRAARVMRRDA